MILLYRTILLLVGGGGLLIAILLLVVLNLSWTNADRLRPLAEHLRLQQDMEAIRVHLAAGESNAAGDSLRALATHPALLASDSAAELRQAAAQLGDPEPGAAVLAERVARVLARERAAHVERLDRLRADNRREFNAVLALAVVLPVLSIALLVFFHRRVLAPVNDLSGFLALVARKDYAMAVTDNVDPLVRPLYEQYNRMVKRIHDVDRGHQKREDTLRDHVDQASRALFQQQVTMTRIERLAAVGEVSARLGHELRNPLSGVLIALDNLRGEIDSDDQGRRLGLAIAELERISHLLTRVVDESRQQPERPRPLRLEQVIGELATLARYQLEDGIVLQTEVAGDLECTLPESGFRHALLNLVLNAAQATAGRRGTVRIAAKSEGETLVVSVTDEGPGFPEELLRAGVHEFGTWRHGGTGLGLATVRRFAFANAGKLLLSNRAQGGACAVLRLPVVCAPQG
jgi:signal transduction histidine kinase